MIDIGSSAQRMCRQLQSTWACKLCRDFRSVGPGCCCTDLLAVRVSVNRRNQKKQLILVRIDYSGTQFVVQLDRTVLLDQGPRTAGTSRCGTPEPSGKRNRMILL